MLFSALAQQRSHQCRRGECCHGISRSESCPALAAARQRKGKLKSTSAARMERYLTFKGDYAKSAELGQNVIAKLPNDREGVVYLAYDLYYLGR